MSSGSVRNSAEHAAIAEAANDLCSGSGGPVGGGLIFLFLSFCVVIRVEHWFSLPLFLPFFLFLSRVVLVALRVPPQAVAPRHLENLLLLLLLLLL